MDQIQPNNYYRQRNGDIIFVESVINGLAHANGIEGYCYTGDPAWWSRDLAGRRECDKESPEDLIELLGTEKPNEESNEKEAVEMKIPCPLVAGKYRTRDGRIVTVTLNDTKTLANIYTSDDEHLGAVFVASPFYPNDDHLNGRYSTVREHDLDLIEGPLSEESSQKLPHFIEEGQVYRTRDGETVTITEVRKKIGVAYFTYKGKKKAVYSGHLKDELAYVGLVNKDGGFKPHDLVELVSSPTEDFVNKITKPLEAGQTYLTRDGKLATVTEVDEYIGIAYHTSIHGEQTAYSGHKILPGMNTPTGWANIYPTTRPYDLMELVGSPTEKVSQMRNLTTIEEGKSYRRRDGDIVKVHTVCKDTAEYIHEGLNQHVWANDSTSIAGQQWVDPTRLENADLVELVELIEDTPENASENAQAVPIGQALVSMINEALERVENGDRALDENGWELNEKGLIEYIILGKDIKWDPLKPEEILFTAPVKFIPENAYYWIVNRQLQVQCRVNTNPSVGKDDCADYHVHLSQEAAQNHARILNKFGVK